MAHLLVALNDLVVVLGIKPVPSVPLGIPCREVDVLHLVVGCNVLVGPLGSLGPGPLEAVLGLVRNGSAAAGVERIVSKEPVDPIFLPSHSLLAGAFPPLGRLKDLGSTVVPLVVALLFLPVALMR